MPTKSHSQPTKQLLKILIGAAWIDGRVQPQERQYLYRVAQEHGLAEDPEIKPLLYELRSVSAAQCYGWIEEYLGLSPSSKDYQELVEAIAALIYSDGIVALEEAKLLERLQLHDPATQTSFDKILGIVQRLYRRTIGNF